MAHSVTVTVEVADPAAPTPRVARNQDPPPPNVITHVTRPGTAPPQHHVQLPFTGLPVTEAIAMALFLAVVGMWLVTVVRPSRRMQ